MRLIDLTIPDGNGAWLDYQSPIELIMGNLQTHFEDNCLKAVQSYGFNIDKEELRKALEYDRGQYAKGYAAARERYKRPQGEWIKDSDNGLIACSHCHTICLYRKMDFCPDCGADMRGVSE